MPSLGVFVIINSRILLLKLGLQINTANYLKDQRRSQLVWLACVMLCGTPCTLKLHLSMFTIANH